MSVELPAVAIPTGNACKELTASSRSWRKQSRISTLASISRGYAGQLVLKTRQNLVTTDCFVGFVLWHAEQPGIPGVAFPQVRIHTSHAKGFIVGILHTDSRVHHIYIHSGSMGKNVTNIYKKKRRQLWPLRQATPGEIKHDGKFLPPLSCKTHTHIHKEWTSKLSKKNAHTNTICTQWEWQLSNHKKLGMEWAEFRCSIRTIHQLLVSGGTVWIGRLPYESIDRSQWWIICKSEKNTPLSLKMHVSLSRTLPLLISPLLKLTMTKTEKTSINA